MFYETMILLCFAAIMIELFMLDLVMLMIYLFRNLIMQLPNFPTTLPSKCNCTAQRTQKTGGWKGAFQVAVSRDGSGALLSNSKQSCGCNGVPVGEKRRRLLDASCSG
jgi:hypothetical protein